MEKCLVCGLEVKNNISLISHLKIHRLTSEKYYLKYILKQETPPKCKECGINFVSYKDIKSGYYTFCSTKCKNSCVEYKKFGKDNGGWSKEAQEKIKKTNLERYGGNPFQNEKIKKKIRSTNIQKYGVENYAKTNEYIKKSKSTNQLKYGVDYHMQTQEYIEKVKESNMKKYGVEWWLLSGECKEKTKQYLKKNNVTHNMQLSSSKEKLKKTCIDRYGCENAMDSQIIIDKWYASLFRRKEYVLPSGKIIMLQGYEPQCMDFMLTKTNEEDIESHPKSIIYEIDGKQKRYHPDFRIISKNLIIEAKSSKILEYQGGIKVQKAKEFACRTLGYAYCLVLDNKFEELQKILASNKD